MNDIFLKGLPPRTREFVNRLGMLGFDEHSIHGLFVATGLVAGAPNTQEEIDQLFKAVDESIPTNRNEPIDQIVGHLYDGFDHHLNEFCFRTGANFSFREVSLPQFNFSTTIVKLKDEGLLDTTVTSINKLLDASRLFQGFLRAMGKSTTERGCNLIESFQCGIFQIQLHGQIDVHGSRQIAEAISSFAPLVIGRAMRSLLYDQVDYFLGLEAGQVAIFDLMQSMHHEYAQQMWAYQSALFFYDQKRIDAVLNTDLQQWHHWAVDRANAMAKAFPKELIPLSKAGIELYDVPGWGGAIENFEACDAFIEKGWGYSASMIATPIEELEYRALIAHAVYSSLTQSREVLH
jgi:hypothetical protein